MSPWESASALSFGCAEALGGKAIPWRSGGDLNPRYPFGVHSLSRGAPSATRPPLQRGRSGSIDHVCWSFAPRCRRVLRHGGGGGIRTLGGLHLDGFQDRCLQPLGHSPVLCSLSRTGWRRQGAGYRASARQRRPIRDASCQIWPVEPGRPGRRGEAARGPSRAAGRTRRSSDARCTRIAPPAQGAGRGFCAAAPARMANVVRTPRRRACLHPSGAARCVDDRGLR